MTVSRALVTADAVVLRTVPFGDSDLVVNLLVRSQGRVGVFARGARKSPRRYMSALEPFCVLSVEYADRPRSELSDLKGVSLVESHPSLRADLARMAHAGYATELVRELTLERQPNDPMYDLIVEFYDVLDRQGASSLVLRSLEMGALTAAGLTPALDGCVRCGTDPARDAASTFDVVSGGVACGRCARGGLPLGPQPLALLRALQRRGLDAASKADARLLPLEPVNRVMRAFIFQHLQRELRSLAFLRDVGAPL